MVSIDEFNTSKLCYECKEQVEYLADDRVVYCINNQCNQFNIQRIEYSASNNMNKETIDLLKNPNHTQTFEKFFNENRRGNNSVDNNV